MNNFSLNLFNVKKIGLKIDDIIDNEMNKNEKIDRCKLASLFHLLRFYHWDNSIHNHITLKLKENEYLINPYNYMSYEITASNLIKVNSDNTILNSPSSGFCINKKTIDIHSTVFKSRPEAKCIAHLQIPCLLTVCSIIVIFRYAQLPLVYYLYVKMRYQLERFLM
uniref:Alpha-adducin (Trinotate prediction) n=1 Tax=Henneguya salminicola TaxID=69463 RepID=A0A6G3MJA1_HENSL